MNYKRLFLKGDVHGYRDITLYYEMTIPQLNSANSIVYTPKVITMDNGRYVIDGAMVRIFNGSEDTPRAFTWHVDPENVMIAEDSGG